MLVRSGEMKARVLPAFGYYLALVDAVAISLLKIYANIVALGHAFGPANPTDDLSFDATVATRGRDDTGGGLSPPALSAASSQP